MLQPVLSLEVVHRYVNFWGDLPQANDILLGEILVLQEGLQAETIDFSAESVRYPGSEFVKYAHV